MDDTTCLTTYNDFHACLNMVQKKGKAYFHMSYSQPPSKSVVDDIMEKLSIIIAHALCFLSGGSSCVCSHHPAKGRTQTNILTLFLFWVPSIHSVCYIYKHYKGIDLEDVLVAGGVIAKGSVDDTLKGKHYKIALGSCMRHS